MLTTRLRARLALTLVLLAPVAARAADTPGVVLQQRWVPGQQLAYDVTVNGTLTLQMPADTQFLMAGVPLDVDLRSNGQTTLDTLSVAPDGTATVAMKMSRLAMKAVSMGQTVEMGLADGKSTLVMNGKPMTGGDRMNFGAGQKPRMGWLISSRGQVEGVVPLPDGETTPATASPAAANTTPDARVIPRGRRAGFDFNRFMQTWVARAMPPFLPAAAVNTGDRWAAQMPWPTPPGMLPLPTGPGAPTLPPMKFEFTLHGQELVGGRQTQRISVQNTYKVTRQQAAALARAGAAAAVPAATSPRRPPQRLVSATQQVKGDVWFDPAAGQLVKAELNVQSQALGENAVKPAAGAAGGVSYTDFAGVVKLELRRVSYSSDAVKTAAAKLP